MRLRRFETGASRVGFAGQVTERGNDELHHQSEMSRVRPGVSDKSAPRLRDVLRPARSHLRLRADSRRDLALDNREASAQSVALSRIAAGRFQRARCRRPQLRLHPAAALQAARRGTRPQASLYKGRHRQPSDPVVQGPGRVGVYHQGARVRLHHRVMRSAPATWRPRSRHTRRARDCNATSSCPKAWRREKSSARRFTAPR